MKKVTTILCLLLIVLSVQAQSKKEREIKEQFWGADDPYKSLVDIPEKWKNESAVILYQEFNYLYKGRTKSVDYRQSSRKRIKLLDKSAVDEYSEFSYTKYFKVKRGFWGKGGKVYTGIKVIKPDGTETELSMDDAVKVGDSQRKLAIPGLEIGDIIDYYFYVYEPFFTLEAYVFEPIVATLNDEYPVMKQRLEFEVGKKFFINFNSFHGAPKLKAKPQTSRKSVVYYLEDEDREKEDGVRWFYPRRVLPIIKFQVTYARKGSWEKTADVFLGEKKTVKEEVSKKEVLEHYQKNHVFTKKTKALSKYIKLRNIPASDTEATIREAYYYLRHNNLVTNIEPIVYLQEDIVSGIPYSYGNFMDDDDFVSTMGSFLKSKKIPFEIIVAVPRFLSTIDELLLKDEITLMIRTQTDNPIYMSRFALHTDFNSIPSSLEGTRAYVLQATSKIGKFDKVKMVDVPVSSHDKNKSVHDITIDFVSADLNELNVSRTVEHYGYNKEDDQSDLIIVDNYLDEEYDYYKTTRYLNSSHVSKKDRKKMLPKIDAKKKKDLEAQKEAFQKNASSEMSTTIEDYDSYKILNQGRFLEDNVFRYEDQFKMEGFTKKAGKNYIFEAGKLIGGQVGLKEDEMERTQDIYMPYARSFENNISINIPEGYEVKGLEKLNLDVQNETGGFTSTAKMEGQVLKIQSKKWYTHNFEPAANWPMMVKFLEAAYQFTEEKVLLKKK